MMTTHLTKLVLAPGASPTHGDWFGFLIRVLSPREAADYLQVPEAVVLKEAEAGRLPGHKIEDEWRFIGGELVRWLYEGPRPTGAAPSQEALLAAAGCLADDDTLPQIVEEAYRKREQDKVGGHK